MPCRSQWSRRYPTAWICSARTHTTNVPCAERPRVPPAGRPNSPQRGSGWTTKRMGPTHTSPPRAPARCAPLHGTRLIEHLHCGLLDHVTPLPSLWLLKPALWEIHIYAAILCCRRTLRRTTLTRPRRWPGSRSTAPRTRCLPARWAPPPPSASSVRRPSTCFQCPYTTVSCGDTMLHALPRLLMRTLPPLSPPVNPARYWLSPSYCLLQ